MKTIREGLGISRNLMKTTSKVLESPGNRMATVCIRKTLGTLQKHLESSGKLWIPYENHLESSQPLTKIILKVPKDSGNIMKTIGKVLKGSGTLREPSLTLSKALTTMYGNHLGSSEKRLEHLMNTVKGLKSSEHLMETIWKAIDTLWKPSGKLRKALGTLWNAIPWMCVWVSGTLGSSWECAFGSRGFSEILGNICFGSREFLGIPGIACFGLGKSREFLGMRVWI